MLQPYRLCTLVRALKNGAVIAYPTEAVFGLGCDPGNEMAVRRLLTIKQRSIKKGLIVIAAEIAQLQAFIEPLSAADSKRLASTWPGPVTWLLPARHAPVWLRGCHETLAVRVTAQPLVAQLCRAFGGPLVSTSANISTRPPARSALHVRRQLGSLVDDIVTGKTGGASRPTEIRDLRSERIVRL